LDGPGYLAGQSTEGKGLLAKPPDRLYRSKCLPHGRGEYLASGPVRLPFQASLLNGTHPISLPSGLADESLGSSTVN
jgi:hypothetical protein